MRAALGTSSLPQRGHTRRSAVASAFKRAARARARLARRERRGRAEVERLGDGRVCGRARQPHARRRRLGAIVAEHQRGACREGRRYRVKERRRDCLGRGKTCRRGKALGGKARPRTALLALSHWRGLGGGGRHTPRKTGCGAGVGRRIAEAAVIGAAVVGDDRALPRRRDARAVAQQQPADVQRRGQRSGAEWRPLSAPQAPPAAGLSAPCLHPICTRGGRLHDEPRAWVPGSSCEGAETRVRGGREEGERRVRGG